MTVERVKVFDLDDTLISRGPPARILGLAGGKIRPHRPPNLSSQQIAKLNIGHHKVDGNIHGFFEQLSFSVHAGRSMIPGVRQELERFDKEGFDIYGNTGRSNKAPWVDMTEKTLENGGVKYFFKDIFYTPDGIKTAVSKAHGIHVLLTRYSNLEFYDDDPRTALFIARTFPNIQVNLVQYGTTGLLVARSEMEQVSNLRRIAVLG